MGRYNIILNKFPENITPPEEEILHRFGFNDIDLSNSETCKKPIKQKKFFIREGERARISFICEEGRKDIFSGAIVHFHGRRQFLCKSTPEHQAVCCTLSDKKPCLRIVIPIIQYDSSTGVDTTGYEVMPWVFGRVIFNELKSINNSLPLDNNDTFVTGSYNRYNRYDIQVAGACRWKQQGYDKEQILSSALSLKNNSLHYLGENLDEDSIRSLLSQPAEEYRPRPSTTQLPEPSTRPVQQRAINQQERLFSIDASGSLTAARRAGIDVDQMLVAARRAGIDVDQMLAGLDLETLGEGADL